MVSERVEINNMMKKYVTLKVAVTAATISWGGVEGNTW